MRFSTSAIPKRRRQAIDTLYTEDAVFYEGSESFGGRAAIAARFDIILDPTPPDFTFSVGRSAGRSHDLEQLVWQLGPAGADPVVGGLDIAIIQDGRIRALYTFLDTPDAESA